MTPGLKSWRTTIVGCFIAVALHLGETGLKMPETRREWWAFAIAVAVAIAGYLTRDAPVTSEMSGVSRSIPNLEAIAKEEAKTELRASVDPVAHDIQLRKDAARRVLSTDDDRVTPRS